MENFEAQNFEACTLKLDNSLETTMGKAGLAWEKRAQ